jgi:2-polyprenyl-6-methoxyphenol hydroxylase-like FAD-dependent oxidoreductase
MSPLQPRIAIVGGGPAGLTAGVLLYKYGVPFTIFELRQKPTIEELAQPTGMLDLHQESGLAAIEKCGLYEEFRPLTGDCAEVFRIADKDGNIVFERGKHGEDRPEISRSALSELLISHIPPTCIQWGYKLHSATSSSASGHTEICLDFGANGKQSFDFVIGADGAWSKVRNLLTDVKPQYSGRQIITVTIRDISKKYPHLAALVGPGTFFALGNRHGVSAQRGSHDSERVYIFITTSDEDFDTTTALEHDTATRTKDKLLSDNTLLGKWGPKTKDLVKVACEEESSSYPNKKTDIRPVYGLPAGHTWDHKPGATLIGDAAHLMPPSGEGVNIGMWDAVMVTNAIIKAYGSFVHDVRAFQGALDLLVQEFEVDMAGRARKAAEEAGQLNEMLFADGGAKAMVEWFKSFGSVEEETSV